MFEDGGGCRVAESDDAPIELADFVDGRAQRAQRGAHRPIVQIAYDRSAERALAKCRELAGWCGVRRWYGASRFPQAEEVAAAAVEAAPHVALCDRYRRDGRNAVDVRPNQRAGHCVDHAIVCPRTTRCPRP